MKIVLTSDYHWSKGILKAADASAFHYFYSYRSRLFDMETPDQVRELQRLLAEENDYREAKIFNEYLIEVTRLKSLEEWLFYPMIIQLEHTNYCNARCIMCCHADADKSKCMDLDEAVFSRVGKLLPFCKYVGLHGYGEPFFARDLIKYFETYQAYGVRLYANSNLSYLPDDFLPYIRTQFEEINVSMDGFTKETFERIRRGLIFEEVVSNIRKLREACPQVKRNLHVTLMQENIAQADKAVLFAHEQGFASITFSRMVAMNEDMQSRDVRNNLEGTSSMLRRAQQRAEELGVPLRFPAELLTATRQTPGSGDIRCHGICDVFMQQIYCGADGSMAMCCVNGLRSVGNILKFQTPEAYWKSGGVAALRQSFKGGRLPPQCRSCNFIYLDQLKHLRIEHRERYILLSDERK